MPKGVHIKDIGKVVKKPIKRLVYEEVPIEERYNCRYDKKKVLRPLVYSISNGYFLEYGTTEYGEKCKNVPDADTIFYRLGKMEIEEVIDYFQSTNKFLLSECKNMGFLEYPLTFGIDTHDWGTYGKRDSYVVGTKGQKGTNYAYRYMSIESLEENLRFTFHAAPMNQFTEKEAVVEELIEKTRTYVPIGKVYLDRGFFAVLMINTLKRLIVPFIIQVVRNQKIEKIIRSSREKAYPVDKYTKVFITDYEMKRGKEVASFHLVIVYTMKDDREDIFAYATNIPVSVENALELANDYRRRWGIETGYRVKKQVRGKTCSTKWVVRLFFMLFSILLYNLWMFCNLLCKIVFFIPTKGYPIIMSRFKSLIYNGLIFRG